MNVWFREQELTDQENELLNKLFEAHRNSCYRDNASSVAVVQSIQASGDLSKAIASALMTIGGRHAPLEKTYSFLKMEEPHQEVFRILKAGNKVPGWGGSFQKEGPDPIWAEVAQLFEKLYPQAANKLKRVTHELHKHEKRVYPNPSAYTAASALALGLSGRLAVYLFIRARIDAWCHIAITQGGG